MTLTMTPEIRTTEVQCLLKEPRNHADRVKYVQDSLNDIMINHQKYFLYFFNKRKDVATLISWLDRKEAGQPYTEKEMLGVYALNSCQIKYIAIASFKKLSLGILEQDQFYEDFEDVPIQTKK